MIHIYHLIIAHYLQYLMIYMTNIVGFGVDNKAEWCLRSTTMVHGLLLCDFRHQGWDGPVGKLTDRQMFNIYMSVPRLPHTACLLEWLTVGAYVRSLSVWPCVCSHLQKGGMHTSCQADRHTKRQIRMEDRQIWEGTTLGNIIWRKKIAWEYPLEDLNLCLHRGTAVWWCEDTCLGMEMIILMDWSSSCKPVIYTYTNTQEGLCILKAFCHFWSKISL